MPPPISSNAAASAAPPVPADAIPPGPFYPQTPDSARAWFVAHGVTVTAWCKVRGVSEVAARKVLDGDNAGRWGNAHAAAIALGIKQAP